MNDPDPNYCRGLEQSVNRLVEHNSLWPGQRKVDAIELKRLAEIYQRPIAFFTGEDRSVCGPSNSVARSDASSRIP